MSWLEPREQNTGPTLRTRGTSVDVKGLTESQELRPGPTQTLTYCVCCLCHCVLENKSFGGDTRSGVPLSCYPGVSSLLHISCLFSVFGHVETTLYHSQYSSCAFSLPCHLPVFSLKWFSTLSNNKFAQNMRRRCVCRVINLPLSVWRQKRPLDKRKASRVRIWGVLKWQLAPQDKQKETNDISCHEAEDETVSQDRWRE